MLVVLLSSSVSTLLGEISLENLKTRFDEKRIEIEAPIVALATNYESQLKALEGEVRAKGELQSVVFVQQEVEEFRDSNFSLPDAYLEVLKLGDLRSIYHRHYWNLKDSIRGEEIALHMALLTRLKELSVNLTKQGETEAALSVDAEIIASTSTVAKLEALNRWKGTGAFEKTVLWELRDRYDLEMRVTENRISVYVDGALRASRQGDFAAANGPVGIGPACSSVVSLEAMTIFAED